jgi:hypothetical protein
MTVGNWQSRESATYSDKLLCRDVRFLTPGSCIIHKLKYWVCANHSASNSAAANALFFVSTPVLCFALIANSFARPKVDHQLSANSLLIHDVYTARRRFF